MTKPRTQRVGVRTVVGSEGARRTAAVVLEVLAGLRSTAEGCDALGVGAMRYYVLETRALQGLVAGLEPRPKGKRRKVEDRLREIERDKARLEREVRRAQALVRLAERTAGVPAVAKTKGTKRRGRVTERGRRAIAVLRAPAPLAASANPADPGIPPEGKRRDALGDPR